MVTFDFTGLLVVAVVAFLAPLLAGLVPGRLVPAVVVEVLLGVAVGPQGLGWVKPQGAVQLLYLMGLGFLLFLAGQDIDPKHFSDPMVGVTSKAYVISLAVAFPVALGLTSLVSGPADLRLIALSLTSSSLGILVPVVRDAGEINSDFGQLTVMAGTVGEFASLLLLTILFSADAKSTPEQILYVAIMGVAAAFTGLGLYALWRSGRMARVFTTLDDSASQLRVRGAFVILLIFAGLAHGFGVDSLLGAFVAGVVLRVADRDDRPHIEVFQAKLDAIGFGFLIPVFFVVTGVHFNVDALFSHSSALELVPLLVIAILVVRGTPALLYRTRVGTRGAIAIAFLQSATLTFPVVVAEVGLSLDLLDQATAAALIGAALLSVVIFPAAALALRPWTTTPTTVEGSVEELRQPPPESGSSPA
jgi:Kef-type K+ transport system membrane component KefB